jgi:hypothetical protein
MPEEPKTPKPRMHGITPMPYEIPKDRLPESKWREKKRTWLVTLFILNNFVHSGFYLLLALVPWSDPDSDLAATLIAHPNLVFGLLPKMVQPSASAMAMDGVTINRVLPGLPVIFLILGILYALMGWKLYDRDETTYFMIRWSMMCNSGYIVAKTLIVISADYVVAGGPRLVSPAALAYLLPVVAWNLLILGYFALMPDVAKAYDEAP